MILEDQIQLSLVFLDGHLVSFDIALILLDGFLVLLDRLLVGEDRLLVLQNRLLIGNDLGFGHGIKHLSYKIEREGYNDGL